MLRDAADQRSGQTITDRLVTALAWLRTFVGAPGRAMHMVFYAASSAIALCCDVGIFLSLSTYAAMPSALAAAIGYVAGAAVHYLLSIRFVYAADRTGKTHGRLVTEFLATGLLGLVLTSTIVWLATDVAGFTPIAGKGISIIVSFVAVYTVRTAVVFAARHDRVGEAGPTTLPLRT